MIRRKKNKIMKIMLDKNAFIPIRAHADDAGYDLKTRDRVEVPAHGYAIVDTGVHMQIPSKYVGFLKSKSGLNVVHSLTGEGVIDSGYTGSIVVKIYNHGDNTYVFNEGDKIIQIVLLPIFTPLLQLVDSFEDNESGGRGNNGFGSTGE